MQKVNFNPFILGSVLGENISLDFPRLFLQDRDDALRFIHAYGYDLSNVEDLRKVWSYHRQAIEILESELLIEDEKIPALLRNREELGDITQLFLVASLNQIKDSGHQKWACAILRVMHVLIHLDNDLFTTFTDDIKYQILKPIAQHVHKEDDLMFLGNDEDRIEIINYEEKSFKQNHSAVVKLLARQDLIALTLLDRVGIRFVTKNVVDIFRVIQYLIDKNLISYPHVISSLSKNTICPTPIFMSALESSMSSGGKIDLTKLEEKIFQGLDQLKAHDSGINPFTSKDFKFLKFITRQFLRIKRGADKPDFTFFYPFEIQILDKETYDKNMEGHASHAEYKNRQRQAARLRVFSDGF
jgi:uncharacterized protein (TIGR04562 family)